MNERNPGAHDPQQPRAICVYCSSSNHVDKTYLDAAGDTGEAIAKRGYRLIYGGVRIGLMGALARRARLHGAPILGVVPEHILACVSDCEESESLIVTPDMRHRKALMEQQADVFLALPGGFGTLEEVLEVITLKQLGIHQKPVVFLNTNGFFDPLFVFFESFCAQRFARAECAALCQVADSPQAALELIEDEWALVAPALSKWA